MAFNKPLRERFQAAVSSVSAALGWVSRGCGRARWTLVPGSGKASCSMARGTGVSPWPVAPTAASGSCHFTAHLLLPQSRDRKAAQDPTAASTYAQTAKNLNIAALCLGIVCTIISIVILVMYFNNLVAGSHI